MKASFSTNSEKPVISLKNLPPINPQFTTPPSTQVKLDKARIVKPSPSASFKPGDTSFGSKVWRKVKTPDVNIAFGTDSRPEGTQNQKKVSAKAQLCEICAANKWKIPLFECCKEEGPDHMKMFTFKVIVEIKDASDTGLDCFSAPRSKKKTALEHAAEGALWYLKHLGYSSKDHHSKKKIELHIKSKAS